jgi:tetratricopeptide (TPR) repeat protein
VEARLLISCRPTLEKRMRKLGGIAIVGMTLAISSCSKDPQKLRQQYIESGDGYVAKKNYAEAIVQYRNATVIDGSFGEGRFKLAVAYEAAGDYENAMREYIRAADLMPGNALAQLRAGQMLLLARQYPEARARAVAMLEKEPSNADGLILMGNALAGLKDFDEAVTQVEEAIDQDPQRTLLYENLGRVQMAKGDKAAAEAAFKRAVDVNPKSASAHASLANYYWASNRFSDAESTFKTALALDPKSTRVLKGLATLYINAKRFADAEEYLKRYVEVSGEVGAKLTLADFYLSMRKPHEAIGILQPLAKEKDGFGPATIRLAAIEYEANRRAHAYELVDSALKQAPKNEQAVLMKARFLLGDRRNSDALALATQAVKANPQSVAGKYLEGRALEATGATDAAIAAFQDVLKLSPSAFTAQVRLAGLYLTKGDFAGAENQVGQGVKAQPTSAVAHFVLTKALLGQNKLALAEAELKNLAKTNANSDELHTLIGELHFARRQVGPARAEFARALELRPDSVEALAGLTKVDLVEHKGEAARTRIESRLANGSNDFRVLMLAGTTFTAVGDGQKAEAAFRKVLELNPASFDAYNALGTLYMMQNRLDDAKRDFEAAARQQPKGAVAARTMIGIILKLQNKRDDARKQYEEVLALDPQAAVAANNLAWDYVETGGNLDVALSLAQTAKGRLPDSWEVDDTLGWIYYKKDLATLAITFLRQGAGRNPSNPTLHYHLGLASLKEGNRKDAKRALEQALKLNPQFAEAEDAKRVLATLKG